MATLIAAGLLLTRLTGWFAWPPADAKSAGFCGLATLFAAFLCAAAIWRWRRPTLAQAATLADRTLANDPQHQDLFSTAVRLDAPGARDDFSALVLARAEQAAAALAPARVVPFCWLHGARDIGLALVVVGLCAAFVPALDPFGFGRTRQKTAQLRERLTQTERATAQQLATLTERPAERHAEVERALARLSDTFQTAQPNATDANRQRLLENQRDLGQLWRQLSEEKLRAALASDTAGQTLGRSTNAADEKARGEWQEALRRGDTSPLQKEVADLREKVRRLEAMPDSAEKQTLRDQVRQRLQTLADAAAKEGRSPALDSALTRALEQLDLSSGADLAKQSLAAAENSLKLSEQELAALSQSLADLKNLENALKALQLAKRLNDEGQLDGGHGQPAGNGAPSSPGDYASLYAQKLAGLQPGEGNGQNPGPGGSGAGIGQGGTRPENGGADSAFRPEESTSALAGGKLLLQWKTRELADAGQAREEYDRAARQVRDGVGEAIVRENVPPGYHTGIQKYFDNLPAPSPSPAGNR